MRALRNTRWGRTIEAFRRRHIAIPVDASALVLDVGSGDKPHWRADVLLDRYPEAGHARQRSGRATARVTRPLFDADAAAMPFADHVFDYAICSHVLEHVPDPAAVVSELTRVARAGYIEVPEAASAKILDFPSHLWWCRRDGTQLVFTANSSRHFDAEIGGYIESAGMERRLAALLDSEFDARVIAHPWRGIVDVRVDGTPDPELLASARARDAPSHDGGSRGEELLARTLTAALTFPRRRDRRRDPVRFDDIVRPDLRRGTDETLEPRIYRVVAP
ncbi:hypothetical protein BH24ACT5_BH24ACT5_04610 [soil metagenome]